MVPSAVDDLARSRGRLANRGGPEVRSGATRKSDRRRSLYEQRSAISSTLLSKTMLYRSATSGSTTLAEIETNFADSGASRAGVVLRLVSSSAEQIRSTLREITLVALGPHLPDSEQIWPIPAQVWPGFNPIRPLWRLSGETGPDSVQYSSDVDQIWPDVSGRRPVFKTNARTLVVLQSAMLLIWPRSADSTRSRGD